MTKKITWDQSAVTDECTFVGEAHAYFERTIISESEEVSAEKIIVSCTALTVLQSSTDQGLQRRTDEASKEELEQDDIIYVGTLNNIPVYMNLYLGAEDVAAQLVGSTDTGDVLIDCSTLTFI